MSFWQEEERVDKPATWKSMQLLGIKKAVVGFSGGHDEGGADEITIYRTDDENAGEDLPLYYGGSEHVLNEKTGKWETRPPEPPTEMQKLAGLLVQPVYEAYGSFAGEFYVSGRVIWDRRDLSVKMVGSEEVAAEHPFETGF